MFVSLLLLVIPWTLDPNNFYQIVNDTVPVLVRFSSQHSSRSLQLENDWNYFCQQYSENPDVKIAHVNCGKYRRLCLKEGEWNTPEIRLYFNHSVIKYDGGMSHDSLTSWLFKLTGVEGKKLDVDLLSPNNRTFHELLANKKCLFTMFHSKQQTKNPNIFKEIENTAKAFHREESIGVAEIDITKFKSFYFDMKITKLPSYKLFINNETIDFEGHENAKDIVDFIDDYCDIQRDVNGFLTTKAGIIEEMDEIVEAFVKSPSEELISKAKNLKIEKKLENDYYINLMDNMLNKGKDWILAEEYKLEKRIKKIKSPNDETDNLQVKLNIISTFTAFLE